jgi:energy-coupling factor transporter transmembrane protein EcfT
VKSEIPSFLLSKPRWYSAKTTGAASRTSFLDRGIEHFAKLIKTTYVQWETARKEGFFQKLDARVKVLFLLFFVVIVSMKRTLLPEVAIGVFVFALAALSRLNLFSFYRRVIFFGFVFGFLVALPSSLNIITRGEVVMPIVHLSKAYHFWVYHIPETVGITRQGIEGVAMLTLRVINSLSLSFLVIYTTPFPEIIKALKSLKVPDPFLMIITLAYKYIFIFARTLEDVYLAKRSKIIEVNAQETRNWVAGRMAFLLRKTRVRCEDVFNAMLARGFSGNVSLYPCRKTTKKDLFVGSFLFFIGFLFLLL